jgi:hypothetical protein
MKTYIATILNEAGEPVTEDVEVLLVESPDGPKRDWPKGVFRTTSVRVVGSAAIRERYRMKLADGTTAGMLFLRAKRVAPLVTEIHFTLTSEFSDEY